MRQVAGPILILCALQIEHRAVERVLADVPDVQVHRIGLRGLRMPVIPSNARAIVLAGIAGALDPTLRVGDVIVDERSSIATPLPRGAIHTSSELITTSKQKRALWERTRARAVSMESAIAHRAAQERGLAYLGIHAISDAAENELDPKLLGLVDGDGNPKMLRAFGWSISHPGAIPQLMRIARSARVATNALARELARVWEGDCRLPVTAEADVQR